MLASSICIGASANARVEQHPTAIRMFTERLEHQLPIDTVEVGLALKIEHPVVAPAELASCAHRIDCRLAGPVAVGAGMGHRHPCHTTQTGHSFPQSKVVA